MRILIACEYSGTVRDAFTALGHDAMSCDFLPTESPGPHHQGDVLSVLDDGWDLMVAHPSCTYLCNSGAYNLHRHSSKNPTVLVGSDRWAALIEGAVFFRRLYDAPIPRVAIENPVMVGYARKIVGRCQDQIVQPWMFGETQTKATALWLRGLPPLLVTEDVQAATMALPYAERSSIHYESPGKDRGKRRSLTFPGLAAAMALQWGGDVREAVA